MVFTQVSRVIKAACFLLRIVCHVFCESDYSGLVLQHSTENHSWTAGSQSSVVVSYLGAQMQKVQHGRLRSSQKYLII